MFENNLKLAWRHFKSKPLFSAINCIGLALGITSFVFIGMFVLDELSYDRDYKDAGRIYRVTYDAADNLPWLRDVPDVAPGIASRLPEIESYTRLFPSGGLVKAGNITFNEEKVFFAGTSFFQVFNLPFLAGNPHDFRKNPNAVVISNTTAKKYFGNDNPIGKELSIAGNDGLHDFVLTVTGVQRPSS